ncbi:hypothetical protein [Tenggerimyces flavus]|uniref:Tetratricopeptide repeat protein n=1 Tax=Tenggerimyces flavus TaxID=1708749 RepID=A0ABV7YIK4_9ACTN|nr:hypothetical protein [Tenggerimyces flavus]MBM7789229.1 tetratricopeptide (TPR) repeat protein [Tenggerimyces flavus]
MNEDELRERLWNAGNLPFGRGQIAVVEEVVRHADALGAKDLQFAARMRATHAYTYGGEPGKSFVTFSWCLDAYDRGEVKLEGEDVYTLLWHFKWMVNALTKFPEVPLDRTYAVLDDMERRYRLAGESLNPVHQYRQQVAAHVGDVETAREQYRLWCAAPRGELSDCVGCEPTAKVNHLRWLGQDEEAVALGLNVLSGELTCIEQPHSMLTALLPPYLHTGRLEEAAAAHRQGYRALQANRAELEYVGDHIAFCGLTGNQARALELIERHLPWLDEAPSPWADMRFSASCALVLEQVSAGGGRHLPVGEESVGALADELRTRALDLVARFDARNGTDTQGRAIRDLLNAEPVTDHLPLSGPARRAAAAQQTAPALPPLPESPQELADHALLQGRLGNLAAEAAAWARFDEVCPEPQGLLLAQRLAARAIDLMATGDEEGWDLGKQAAALYAEGGDEVRRQVMLSRLGIPRGAEELAPDDLADIENAIATLSTLGDPDEEARAWVSLGMARLVLGQLDEASAGLEHADGLAVSPALRGSIAQHLADVVSHRDDEEALTIALAHLDRGITLYQEAGGDCGRLRHLQFMAAGFQAANGELEKAFDLTGLAASVDEPTLRGEALYLRGRLGLDLERMQEAYEALTGAVADLLAVSDVERAAYARVELTYAAHTAGHLHEAADAAEEAIPVLERLGDADETARAKFLLAKVHRDLDQPDAALALLDDVVAHCLAQENVAGAGQMHATAGELLDKADRDAAAAERFTLAAEAYATLEAGAPDQLENWARAAKSWHWAEDNERSFAALARADAVATTLTGDEPETVWKRALLSYEGARLLAAAERFEEALPRTIEASAGFRSIGELAEATIAETLRGRLLVDLDRPKEAEPVLAAVLEALPAEDSDRREEIQALLEEVRRS